MIITELVVSIVIASLLTGLYTLVTRGAGRRTGLMWLFLVIFLATWAGGIWLRSFGPTLWGVHWLVFLVAGAIVTLILIMIAPGKAPKGRHETLDMLDRIEREKELEQVTYVTLSIFLWVLLSVLVMAIILRYIVGVELP